MADEVEFVWDDEKFREAMQRAPVALARHIKQRLGSANKGYLSKWLRDEYVRSTFTGSTTDSTLHTRSGSLVRSFRVVREGTKTNDLVYILGSFGTKYAVTHEYGATIRAKPGKALTIPFPAALTPAGVLKKSARQYMEQDNVFIVKGKKGPLIVRRDSTKAGKNERWTLLFALKKQVKVPARMGLRKSFQDQMPELRRQVMLAADDALGTAE